MKYILLAALALSGMSAAALAQPAPPKPKPPTSSDQAISNKLLREINDGLACDASKIDVQRQLNDSLAQVKDLQAKLAAPPPP